MAKYVGIKRGDFRVTHEINEYYCCRCGHSCTDHDNFCRKCGGAFKKDVATNHDDFCHGFEAGYAVAKLDYSDELRQLRDCLRAILDRGEAPAHVMSDE